MTHSGGERGRVVAGRYRLGAVLGRGGMGTVWHAVDEMLHRDVAVKELRLPDYLDDEEREVHRERTLREARTAARVSHENVVTIHDVVEDGGIPWIVMELVEAESLAEIISTRGTLPVSEAAEVGLKVLGALQAAYERGVLHRDVKPANILVTVHGRVVLTDFGIATVTGSATLTPTGMLVGSPEFLAPERAEGRRPDLAADLWSLGLVLYMAIEGRNPFNRGSMMGTLTAILQDDPEPPRHAGMLAPVIDGWLRKSPEGRLSAEQGAQMLRAIARGEPGTAVTEVAAILGTDTGPTGDTADNRGTDVETAVAPSTPDLVKHPRSAGDTGYPGAQGGYPQQPSVGHTHHQPPQYPPGPPQHHPATPGDDDATQLGTSAHNPLNPWPTPEYPPADLGPTPHTRRRASSPMVLAVVSVVIALIAAGTVVAVLMTKHDSHNGAAGASGSNPADQTVNTEGQPGAVTPPPSGPATAPGDTPGDSQNGTPPPAATTAPGKPTLPDGYVWTNDPAGFALAVPDGWTRRVTGANSDQVDYVAPNNTGLLRIGLTQVGDPLDNFRSMEGDKQGQKIDYQRLKLESYPGYRSGWNTAVWEFTFTGNPFTGSTGSAKRPSHAIDLGFTTDKDQDFAIYAASFDDDWSQVHDAFDQAVTYFRVSGER